MVNGLPYGSNLFPYLTPNNAGASQVVVINNFDLKHKSTTGDATALEDTTGLCPLLTSSTILNVDFRNNKLCVRLYYT